MEPFRFIALKVGWGGRHYHLGECPATEFPDFPKSPLNDYLTIEVPHEYLKKHKIVTYLGKKYQPCGICNPLLRKVLKLEKQISQSASESDFYTPPCPVKEAVEE